MNQELVTQIEQKRRELNNLEYQYEKLQEEEKTKVLKSKSEGFKKSFYLLGFEFESSSCRTPQYLEFHRTFKSEFKRFLKGLGVTEIEIGKPNHFDISGFFKYREQVYYFSISDLRWSKDSMLIRTAKDFKDYSGGSNDFISLDSEEEFLTGLRRVLR